MTNPTHGSDVDHVGEALASTLSAGRVELAATTRAGILSAVAAERGRPSYELAVFNIARFTAPMDDPLLTDFVAGLDRINAIADAAPGFVWRLTDEGSNNATSIEFYDDPLQLVNLSVWADVDAVRSFVYRTAHVDYLRRRAEWAEHMDQPYIVLWWVPAGHRPDVAEADAHLQRLRRDGPSADAFTFARAFPAPSANSTMS